MGYWAQAAAPERASALAALLESALSCAGGRPARPLPRLATAFAAKQVSRAAAAATGGTSADKVVTAAGGPGGDGDAAAATAGFAAVMQQALAQLEVCCSARSASFA